MELTGVDISEVAFNKRISKREFCEIFLVTVRNLTCVMKVHRGRRLKRDYEPRYRETNIYICESTAYRRLTEAGICAKGLAPKFYGTIEDIDPMSCQPHLKDFVNDEYPPTAIFLEYIPNMKELHWTNYNEKRMRNFVDGINKIHKALVFHGDIHPRNMMTVEDDPERAIWIDFDRAQTFNEKPSERQQKWIDFENELVDELAQCMKHDFTEGEMDTTL
ncbi:hypothetical protein AJ79_05097 [Helicocarpus griseus UAMH5409]|uniref:Protein kinase domain-containing protein n=1 Tax=Helicocarpus griseus UAMH5409 TaxID=1447875 RepID=A0A2B7XQ08_9EURO|nr:hypothetical protein AJ79_05097 [Helicocarpus griseus UAMH5409]